MAPTADRSGRTAPALDLGRIDEVRVHVEYGLLYDGPPDEVYLLDLPVDGTDHADLEPVLMAALEPLLGVTPLRWSVHVGRHHTNRGARSGEIEVRMSLSQGSAPGTQPPENLEAVTDAFRAVLEQVQHVNAADLHGDEAVTRARVRVGQVHPSVHAETLTVADQEHRAADGAWSVRLVTPDQDRYVVVVGFVDGYAGSAQVRRLPRHEVMDSVGAE